jgi:hypothetical protein
LCVILGPLVASAVCAKKTNATERISSTEITSLWKEAMVSMWNDELRAVSAVYMLCVPLVRGWVGRKLGLKRGVSPRSLSRGRRTRLGKTTGGFAAAKIVKQRSAAPIEPATFRGTSGAGW